ncbi:MAG TPA: RHS repeat protein, partial [Bacteroidia bacterium]|nr:RHS repeat protein [Bacteroidia bacterium]
DPETAAEAQIAAAADHHLAYQEDRRVVRQSLRGGQDLYQYNYQGNADAPSFGDKNTWAACSEMVLPDGNRKRYYTNRSGGLVLEAREDVALGRTSYQAIQRNADGRMVQKATPAAIGSVVEPGSGSGSLQVNLKPDSGLIYEYGYAAATNPGTGEIKGLPTTRSIRQGASGTAEKVSTLVWTTQTANGVSIHKPSAEIRYTGVMAGSAAARSHSGDARALDEEEEEVSEYQYDYLYYKDAEDNNTFQVLQKTTTLPVIPLSQNGDGQTYTIVERFDEYGHRIWMKNARGYITRWEYVIETGALKRRIEDVDTARLENVPEGWTTPSDGGKHLTYDYESDLQGRIVRELGPPHEAVLKECDRKATVLRSAQFTLHQDALHETWRVAGYATGDAPSYGYETVGAVTIQRRDAAGRLLDTIQARRSCCCGPLQAGEQFPQRQWTRWTKYFYDAWGRVTKTRIYHRIPKSGEGFRGEHYYESRTGYDDLGRVIRQQTPGGTLTRLVYDSEGRLASIWVGTNDRQATPGDPTGGGASRNNMVVRFSYEYDHGQPGGNGLLTRRTEHVDADPLNDRVTEYTYDYRGWLDETHRSDGTTLFIEKNFYDNQGSVIQMDAYHTSAVAANLTRRMEWRYDFQKRVYRTDKWSVEPGTGEVGYALVSQIWFDGAGNVIRSQGAGSRAFSKVQYDSLNREIHRYLAWNPGSSTLDNDVDLDTVIEQTDSHYDDVGDLLWISQRQRYEDATGTGPLQHSEGAEPKARVSHTAYWYDGIRRPVAEAAYGTNGGAAFHRPAIVPQRSDLVLVHSNRYAADGEPAASIDPAGTETQWENDAAGNQICLVENYRPDVPEDGCEVPHDVNRTTEYRYNADGQLEYLILINPVTGDQVTQWLYGTTLEDSSVARTDLLRTKI